MTVAVGRAGRARPHFLSRLRATVLAGSVCLLVAGGLSALIVVNQREELLEENGTRLQTTASLMAERMDTGLQNWAKDVSLLARFSVFQQEPPDRDNARQLLEDLKTRSPEFSWIGFTGTDGRVIAATGRLLEGVDVSARPWFGGGLRGLYLGDVHPAVLLARLLPADEGGENAYFVDAAAPVRGSDGRVKGVVAGHLNWRWAETLRQEMLRLAPSREAPSIAILSKDNVVLLGDEGERGKPGVTAAPAGSAAGWIEEADGKTLTGFAHTQGTPEHPGLGWTVLVRRDATAILAPLWTLSVWLALGTIAIGIGGGLLAGWQVSRFGRALRAINQGSGDSDAVAELDNIAATLTKLRDAAYRDPLTGLLNRAGFATWREANPAAEKESALLALDLDGFKPINDKYGHAAGDAVLVAIGHWLQANLRQGDCAVRTGGDEFVLCLLGPADKAETAANGVAARFQAMLSQGMETSLGRMTLGCSIGMAIVPRDAAGIDEAINVADAALYRIKHARGPSVRRIA
ncbi:GGDEF domain-containing protein [Acetobacteraceae bacterium H6797]|nr:GGDEF domain-containing protein [Acetobacteraceae bacterium H6797]